VSRLRQALLLAGRDLAVEAAGRDTVVTVAPFALAAVILVGLGAGVAPETLGAVGPTVVWLVVLLAAVPVSAALASQEREDGCWDLLRGLLPPVALLGGKVAVAWLLLGAVWAVTAGLVAALYTITLPAAAVVAGVLGTLGVATVTVLFAVVVSGASRRPGLLAVLVLPAALPVLLAGAQAGVAPRTAAAWLGLLVAYDAVALAMAWAAFPVLLEE
jgi:heme exporter protein B